MIVKCAKCGTKFRLDEAKIGPKGAKVRCSKCQTTFVVQQPPPSPSPNELPEEVQAPNPLELGARLPAPALGLDLSGGKPPVGLNSTGKISDQVNTAPGLDLPGMTSPSSPPGSSELPDLPGAGLPKYLSASGVGPIHEMKTAVYEVPPELREKLGGDDPLALDMDAPPPAAFPGPGTGSASIAPDDDEPTAGASFDLDASQATGLRPLSEPGLGDSPGDSLATKVDIPSVPSPATPAHDNLDDLPMEDADLIEAASAPDMPAPPSASGGDPGSLSVLERPLGAGASDAVESMGGEGLDDPLGGPHLGDGTGSVSSDGTFVPPSATERPFETAAAPADTSSGRIELARIKPAKKTSGEIAAVRAERAPASGSSIGVNIVMSIVVVVAIGFGVLLYLGGGRLDLSVVGLGKKSGAARATSSSIGYQDVFPASLRSVTYPTAIGNEMLIFVGTAENRSGDVRKQIDVVAELRDAGGRVVASERAPLGLPLGPAELYGLTDGESVAEAFRALAREHGEPTVAAGTTVPFTVVLLEPPSGLSALSHTVFLKAGGAVLPAPEPEPEPEPVVEPEPRKGKRKGKRRGRKDKRRGRKGKRKAKAALDEE
ncbi:MAG: zinc-ribbon domain-containing protein [Myxococcota bacterium]